jgi:signal transduction histidine kinase
MSTINWYSEMLLSGDVGKLTLKQRKYSQEIYHASQRMVALVNALLNVSRLELGTFIVEPKLMNITKIAKNCLKDFSPQISKKKLKISQNYKKCESLMKIDERLVTIIFQNFLSNSIKYTKSGGRIQLKIDSGKDGLLISVSDNGIGIPKEQQKEIFSKLFRADNAKKMDPDGSGLGLYIVKKNVGYTKGNIWFESKKGKGTTFYAKLPSSGMIKKEGKKELILSRMQ